MTRFRTRTISTIVAIVVVAVFTASLAAASKSGPGATSETSSCDVATITWDGGAGTTDWGTATNWNPDRLPATSDHVCIPAAAPGAEVVGGSAFRTVLSLESLKPLRLSSSLSATSTSQASNLRGGVIMTGTSRLDGAGRRIIGGVSDVAGATFLGTGQIVIEPDATVDFTGSTAKSLGAPILNNGSVEITGPGSVTFHDLFQNAGELVLAADAPFGTTTSNRRQIVNTGTIVKTSTGPATLAVPFENDGLVRIDAGALVLTTGSGANRRAAGTWTVAEDAIVAFSGSTFLGDAGQRFDGPGAIEVQASTTFEGPAQVDVHDVAWQAGTLGGVELVFGPDTTVTETGTVQRSITGSIRNDGVFRFAGTGTVVVGLGSVFTNTNVIDFRADTNIISAAASGTRGVIHNEPTGTIMKTGGASNSVAVGVANQGEVFAESGTLQLTGGTGPVPSTGRYWSSPGPARVSFAGNLPHLVDGTVEGPGTVAIQTGELRGDFAITDGATLDWVSGILHGGPDAVIEPGAALVSHGGTAGRTWRGALRNDGTVKLGGTGTIGIGGGLAIVNSGLVELTGDWGFGCVGCLPVDHTIVNERTGIIHKVSGPRNFIIPGVTNHGDIVVDPGATLWLTYPTDTTTGANGSWHGDGTWTVKGDLVLQSRLPRTIDTTVLLHGGGRVLSGANSAGLSSVATIATNGTLGLFDGAELVGGEQGTSVSGSLVIGNRASFSSSNGLDLSSGGVVDIAPDGELRVGSGNEALRGTGGLLTGGGTVIGEVAAGATIRPRGPLRVTGAMGAGLLDIVLDGRDNRVVAGSIPNVSGLSLRVRVEPGHEPTPGQTFRILEGPTSMWNRNIWFLDADETPGTRLSTDWGHDGLDLSFSAA